MTQKNKSSSDSLISQIKQWAVVGTPVILTICFSFILQLTVLSRPELISTWLASFGVWFILAYILIQLTAIIIAPLGGAFVWIALLAIVGPAKALVLFYLVTTPAFFINFYLAKRYGRVFLRKLMGDGTVEKIESIASNVGVETAWILKIFQGGQFDYFSYALGLTKMSYKQFAVVNIVGGIPSALIYYAVLSQFENFTLGIIALNVITAAMVITSIGARHWYKKRMKKLKLEKLEEPEITP